MRTLAVACLLFAIADASSVQDLMQHAFYPVLLSILILASLGLPIPEDIPLITAGVLLKTHPDIASWHGTLIVALVGIMLGDLVLYSLGRMWGPEVVRHRVVRWLITPQRYEKAAGRFCQYGTWFCFFGRFLVGVRAAMCLTAGATRFPYWRFFLADFAGALLSVPLFVCLGYWFAGMIPTLQVYLVEVQGILLLAGLLAVVAVVLVYRYRAVWKRGGAAVPAATPTPGVKSRFEPEAGGAEPSAGAVPVVTAAPETPCVKPAASPPEAAGKPREPRFPAEVEG